MSLPLPLSFCFLFSKEEMPPVVSDIYFLKQMGIFKGAEGDFLFTPTENCSDGWASVSQNKCNACFPQIDRTTAFKTLAQFLLSIPGQVD